MRTLTRTRDLAWMAGAAALLAAAAALSGPLDMVPPVAGDAAGCLNPATATARSEPRAQ